MPLRYCFFALFPVLIFLASCEKKEHAITLPAAGSARYGRVDMGNSYDTVIYYDYEQNIIVKTSRLNCWDLAFESAPDGRHVFLNGGTDVTVINTHSQSFEAVKAVPATVQFSDWLIDSPDGSPEGTGIGAWTNAGGISNGDVYIVQLGTAAASTPKYWKIKFLSVNTQQYVIQYGDLSSGAGTTLTLPKVAECNCSYFSFTGGIAHPEPPKGSWDVVFTHYKELVYDASKGHDIPYSVTGVLLNPLSTAAAQDSTHGYANIDLTAAQALPASSKRNAIGYSWKDYNITAGQYTVHPNKVYILHSRDGHIIKLHFLDFLSPNGIKGSPSFESEVML